MGASSEPEEESSEADVSVAPAVVVASSEAANAAEVLPDGLRIPAAVAREYSALPAGTIFVAPRGSPTSKNPDGFLRRIVSTKPEGALVVFTTTDAVLTDAIVNGSVRASTNGSSIDGELRSARDFEVELDFSKEKLFDEPGEAIRFDQASLVAKPSVDVDVRISGGKVTRFMAKVEGNVEAKASINFAITSPTPKKHEISKVLFQSKRVPLPTFAVGKIPLSTAVQLTVTMKCNVAFDGPINARGGFDAKGYVRLAALNQDGTWKPPSKSELAIEPAFEMDRAREADVKCVLETETELSAYGMPGVKMVVGPYLDFHVDPLLVSAKGRRETSEFPWTATAGATGALRGNAEVFGLVSPDQELAHWQRDPLRGETKK
jgi:hypothetical protein